MPKGMYGLPIFYLSKITYLCLTKFVVRFDMDLNFFHIELMILKSIRF